MLSFVLVSYGCCDKLLQPGWLKTTEMCHLTQLEARRLKSESQGWNQGLRPFQGLLGKACSLPLRASAGHHLPGFVATRSNLCLCDNPAASSSGCATALGKPLVIVLRAQPDNPGSSGLLQFLNLTHLQDPWKPHKVTLTGPRDQRWVPLDDIFQPLHSSWQADWSFHL